MNQNHISFMNANSTSSNVINDETTLNTDESDYKNLITRLKEISETINVLGKTIFK